MGAERKKKAGPHCPPPYWQLSRLVGAAELDRQEEHSPKHCAPDAPPPAGLLSSAVTTESGHNMIFFFVSTCAFPTCRPSKEYTYAVF